MNRTTSTPLGLGLFTIPPYKRYDLAMHCIGKHCNIAAVHNDWFTNFQFHWDEHTRPGGIRNHERSDLRFDEAQVESVLEEFEARECPRLWPEGREPIFPQVYTRTRNGRTMMAVAVRLTGDNAQSVVEWLDKYKIAASWTSNPLRLHYGLHYGGLFGSYSFPPGYWIAVVANGPPVIWMPRGYRESAWAGSGWERSTPVTVIRKRAHGR